MRALLDRYAIAVLTVVTMCAAAVPSALQAAPKAKPQMRCGWIQNPTPANWWLTDADGQWTLMSQGGEGAEDMDLLPDFTEGEWVETNGSYGYGCACLRVDVDRRTHDIKRIYSAKQKPLSACKADRKLPKPE